MSDQTLRLKKLNLGVRDVGLHTHKADDFVIFAALPYDQELNRSRIGYFLLLVTHIHYPYSFEHGMVLLFRHSAKGSIAQKERLSTSH